MQRTAALFAVASCWVFCFFATEAGAQESTTVENATPAEDQYSGDGCIPIATLSGNTAKSTEPFGIGNTTLQISFNTTPANNRGFNSTDILVVDETQQAGGTQIDSTEAFEGEDGVLRVPVEAGRYSVQVETFEQAYQVVVEAEGGTEPCIGGTSGDPQPPGPVDRPEGVIGPLPVRKMPPTGGPPIVLGTLALLGTAVIVGRGVLRR